MSESNVKRYVLVKTYSLEEFAMPGPASQTGSNDPRARLNIGAIREIAKADVVIAIDPSGNGKIVFDKDVDREALGTTVTMIDAFPEGMA